MKLTGHIKQHIKRLRQLIVGKKSESNSKLLSDKFSSELSTIPELDIYIDNKVPIEKKIIFGELGTFIQIKEFNKGHFFRRIYETNADFIMLLRGKIMEFEIKYVYKSISFKEYILFVIKLFLLKEKFLYYDCIEKNKEAFPFNIFKYFITNNPASLEIPEEEKNHNDKKWIKDINIIEICKELNVKNFEFNAEYEKLKNQIHKLNWKNFDTTNIQLNEEEYEYIFETFFNIYNLHLNLDNENNNKNNNEEVKYKVCLPFFYKKRIINPVSYIGDLNRPIQMKNYSSFVCLNDCFIIYADKSKLSPIRPIYKYIYNNKKNYIAENLFTKHFLFENIDVDYLSKFGKYMHLIKLNKDEILFKQGDPHRGVYIIMNGNIQLESYQSYTDLIDINFLLLHSLDYCPNFISKNKINELEPNFTNKEKKNKNYLSGYYDYNSKLNDITKIPTFQANSKIKENIIFSLYTKNDIIGLGETFDYKYKISIFTAKSLNNDTELIFIPNEIFQALLSIESIYNKLGLATEEKTKILNDCIDKYKKNFENKIQMIINRKQMILFKKKAQNFRSLYTNNKKLGISTNNNNKNIESSPHKIIYKINNKSQISENDKSCISKFEKNIKTYKSQNINILKNPIQKVKSSDYSKLLLNPKMYKHSMIHRRNNFMSSSIYLNENYDNNALKKRMEDISNFFCHDKKDKRISQPIFFSYEFKSENSQNNIFNNKYKKSQKIKLRSFSAKKSEEQFIKNNILGYQIKKKERNRYYDNNLSTGNTFTKKNSIFPKKNILLKSSTNKDLNKLNILNTKKMIINKFNYAALFKKNSTNNNKSKQNC